VRGRRPGRAYDLRPDTLRAGGRFGGEFTMPSRREVWGFAVELAIAVAILAVASVVFAGVWNALKWLVGW
jgi:hypothetical protein